MRRGGPPILPLDAAGVPPYARVERGARGLRFAPLPAPEGAAAEPGAPLRAMAGAPAALRRAAVVADGALVLGVGAGVAYTLRAPAMQVIHDRRPPGLDRAAGAAGANAGLLHGADGWRMVVLPSLGDVAADLGPGPVALRPDGRRLAVALEGRVEEHDLPGDGPAAVHEGPADALAYLPDGTLLAAAGAAVGAPGAAPAADGPPVVELHAAAAAPRAAALHADGTVTVWEAGAAEPLGRWAAPPEARGSVALSPDGALVALGSPEGDAPVAVVVDARGGAPVRVVEGARAIAFGPEPGTLVVSGDWGCAWLSPPEEA
ncbi:WD40 repeat domain-containing protein [Miltoncostaea marina]|uniref:WD40 repeat domain-containing protein n=1 Tax=Miltoncostaea marina TaxID=2843215 RepID=UPI001C3D6360|nr:hypothetical protein [Miltoncostaea marina]